MERTSLVNLRASNIGSKSNRAVSWKSENQDVMGIALSVSKHKTAKAVILLTDKQWVGRVLLTLVTNVLESQNHHRNVAFKYPSIDNYTITY